VSDGTFPLTRQSVVEALKAADSALRQRAFEREYFARFDARRARFRTFLRMCVDAFAANERQAAQRLKRGGGAEHVSLEYATAEAELAQATAPDDFERFFAREWVRAIFSASLAELRDRCEREGSAVHYAIFVRYDLAEGRLPGV